MYLVDYHIHPYAHGDVGVSVFSESYLNRFIKKAKEKGIKEIGFSDHEWYIDKIDWPLLKHIKRKSDIKIRIGLEIDYCPDREEEIREIIKSLNLDYTIGSVHTIGDWKFDHPDYIKEYDYRDMDQVYISYYELVLKLVRSGLFSIVGHLDLIKIFGFKPDNVNIFSLIEPVLQEIKNTGMAIEVNTNGINKPVREYYPAIKILKEAIQQNIPIVFGSDAHMPDRVGEGINKAAAISKNLGLHQLATFSEGKIKLKRLN